MVFLLDYSYPKWNNCLVNDEVVNFSPAWIHFVIFLWWTSRFPCCTVDLNKLNLDFQSDHNCENYFKLKIMPKWYKLSSSEFNADAILNDCRPMTLFKAVTAHHKCSGFLIFRFLKIKWNNPRPFCFTSKLIFLNSFYRIYWYFRKGRTNSKNRLHIPVLTSGPGLAALEHRLIIGTTSVSKALLAVCKIKSSKYYPESPHCIVISIEFIFK